MGWDIRWDSVVSGSLGSQKEQGCLGAAEFLGVGAGKAAAISEPRRGPSAQCGHEP